MSYQNVVLVTLAYEFAINYVYWAHTICHISHQYIPVFMSQFDISV